MPSHFEALEQFPEYLVIIQNMKDKTTLMGLFEGDEFSYNLGASLGASAANIATDVGKGAGKSLVKRMSGEAGEAILGIAESHTTNIASTLKGYDQGNPTPFSLSLHVFRGSGTNPDKYSEIVRRYSTWTQPKLGLGGIMQSHLYEVTDMDDILTKGADKFKNALISVQIGSWFHAMGLFCESVQPVYSTIVDEDKQPIYLKLQCSFVPYKVLTPEEISEWHR
jgi:hypothetical protein